MCRGPWITFVVSVVIALSPIGHAFIHSAFYSYDQLGRNIAQPLVLIAIVVAVAVGAIEWAVRRALLRRRGAAAND
jgi:hypothetical protein